MNKLVLNAGDSFPASDAFLGLAPELLFRMHGLMVEARLLEERLISMSKMGQGFFWIGGPGEEAFNVALGLQVKKGRGPAYDFLHLNYRSYAVLLAMGGKAIDTIRQMRSVRTDPFSKGRQFVNHPSVPDWNVVPVSPTIETQYSTAIGTGIALARFGGDAVTIVTGGDGGTAEGDFHSCLVWANRPALPLPMLIIVNNNGWAISTAGASQHGEKDISDWGRVFDMPHETVDGNDPAVAYRAIERGMAWCRSKRRPYLLEVRTSRLNGHSSSTGANRVREPDCIAIFEGKLLAANLVAREALDDVWRGKKDGIERDYKDALEESYPDPQSIWEDVYSGALPSSYPRTGGS